MKALKLLLAVALGIAVLVPGATATAQSDLVVFEEAESLDDTCDLLLNDGGPYEVSIAGSIAVVYENGSVVSVPQGDRVNYRLVARTFGSTGVGITESCAEFVPPPDTGGDGISAPVVVVAGVLVLALLGAASWFVSKARVG